MARGTVVIQQSPPGRIVGLSTLFSYPPPSFKKPALALVMRWVGSALVRLKHSILFYFTEGMLSKIGRRFRIMIGSRRAPEAQRGTPFLSLS